MAQMRTDNNQQAFFELLQLSLGTRDCLSRAPSALEWEGLFTEADKQALIGIIISGLERLPEPQKPPKELLLTWIGITIQIEQQNKLTTPVCKRICQQLEKAGFTPCILKGQSNYRYYPPELRNKRSCGDVDVWVQPEEEGCKHPVKTVIEYVQSNLNMNGLCWLHTSHEDENGVPVEMHLRASFMSEPCKNRRFQKHFANVASCRDVVAFDGVELPVMKVDEDVIYQMNHIYRHLIDEGVGLRQVVDYFFLLKAWHEQHTRTKEETMKIVSWLGMKKFAGALMYVLREVCGMTEDILLCPASLKDGQFLMSEIMLSGNFGRGDPRMAEINVQGYFSSRAKQVCRRFKRNMRFLTSYPGEVMWEPIVRVEHFVWKKLKLWRF
jgi:hypothetical protein